MGRPHNNGLVEFVDAKSHDRGFFCMKLASFLNAERNEQGVIPSDKWDNAFNAAKLGECFYKDICPVYARTRTTHSIQPRQLTLNF